MTDEESITSEPIVEAAVAGKNLSGKLGEPHASH